MARKYIPVAVRDRVTEDGQDRCGYCLHPQRLVPDKLQIDHIIPLSKGGPHKESNFWLACDRFKQPGIDLKPDTLLVCHSEERGICFDHPQTPQIPRSSE